MRCTHTGDCRHHPGVSHSGGDVTVEAGEVGEPGKHVDDEDPR